MARKPKREPEPAAERPEQPERVPHWWSDSDDNFLPGVYEDADPRPESE